MPQQSNLFHLKDGTSLFGQSWSPEGNPKGLVLIVHGYAEHSDRYHHVANRMVQDGLKVVSYDQRWHGRSPGKRAFLVSFERLVDDLQEILHSLQVENEGIPIFLYGHSMGAGVAAWFVIDRKPKVKGVILSGIPAKVSDDISPFLVKMAPVLNRIAPKLKTIALESAAISRDQKVVEAYLNDPLVYSGKTYARTGNELLRMTHFLQARMEEFALPVLIMHGTGDRISDAEGSRQLHQRAQAKDKTLRLFEGWYHEIHNEPEQQLVLDTVAEWIEKRLS